MAKIRLNWNEVVCPNCDGKPSVGRLDKATCEWCHGDGKVGCDVAIEWHEAMIARLREKAGGQIALGLKGGEQ